MRSRSSKILEAFLLPPSRRAFAESNRRRQVAWLLPEARARREQRILDEARRPEATLDTFRAPRLTAPASWGVAQLDPPLERDQPTVSEPEAREVALAMLRRHHFPEALAGEHLVFCRFSHEATRRQPVWLAAFLEDSELHLIVINAESDRPLGPIL